MSRARNSDDDDIDCIEDDDGCSFAVVDCPCGRMIAFCVPHGGVIHQPPVCQKFRTMKREAYLDYVNDERDGMLWDLIFEQANSEGWPRA